MKSKMILLTIALLGLAGAVSAHHGAASYNMDQNVTIKGTVTEFDFINPHVLIYLDVKDDHGQIVNWAGELTSPNRLSRVGWTKNTLKVGDEVTMVGAPAKAGTPRMWANKVSNAGGELKTGGVD
jgi:hypothetical protein